MRIWLTDAGNDPAPKSPTSQRFDREAEIVVGSLPRRPLMHDRDAALDQAIRETAPILADALLRLLFPESATRPFDSAATESPHVTAG